MESVGSHRRWLNPDALLKMLNTTISSFWSLNVLPLSSGSVRLCGASILNTGLASSEEEEAVSEPEVRASTLFLSLSRFYCRTGRTTYDLVLTYQARYRNQTQSEFHRSCEEGVSTLRWVCQRGQYSSNLPFDRAINLSSSR